MDGGSGEDRAMTDALDRLANALVDDILNTTDDDILAEVTEDNGDPEKIAEEMRALFERTVQEQGKAKFPVRTDDEP